MNEICVQTVDRLNDDKLQLSRFKLDRWWNARHLGMDKTKKSLAMPGNEINKLCVDFGKIVREMDGIQYCTIQKFTVPKATFMSDFRYANWSVLN